MPGNRGKNENLALAMRTAAGLSAAAVTAYGVYLMGRRGGRRPPATELPNALGLPLRYQAWRDGLCYAYHATKGSGPPLVLLHSVHPAATSMEVKPLLRLREMREGSRPCLVPEWLGFGHSDRPDVRYDPQLFEDQLEHFLLQRLPDEERADIVAHGVGAAYAAFVAARRPERIRSLVLIEPTPLREEPARIGSAWSRLLFTLPGIQRAFFDRVTQRGSIEAFYRRFFFGEAGTVPPELLDHAVRSVRIEGASRPLDDILRGRVFPADLMEALLRLRIPLLIVRGTDDRRRPEPYRDLPELVDRVNVHLATVDAGGMPQWERTEEVLGAIREFFDSVVEEGR